MHLHLLPENDIIKASKIFFIYSLHLTKCAQNILPMSAMKFPKVSITCCLITVLSDKHLHPPLAES